MLLKGQFLGKDNLNNAFLSLTNTSLQAINSSLNINGGQLSLKNSVVTDNANAGYLKIDPQGNQVIIYDGVNNQSLAIFSSSGSENTYITTINQANNKSFGLIDLTGASVDHLEINTNSHKPTIFGGPITVNYPMGYVNPSGSTIAPAFKIVGTTSDFRIGVQDGAGRVNLLWNAYFDAVSGTHKYATANGDAAVRMLFDQSAGIQFHTAPASPTSGNTISWTVGLVNTMSGLVGIGTTTPQTKLHIAGGGDTRLRIDAGNTNQYAGLQLQNNLATNNIYTDTNGHLQILSHPGKFTQLQRGIVIGTPMSIVPDGQLNIGKNGNPAISAGSYANGHIQLVTNDGTHPVIGFHRGGYTAVALYHDGDMERPLKMITSGGMQTNLMVSSRKTAAQLNDPINLASGIYTNTGDGILNANGTVYKAGWWHVTNYHHYDNNGYGAQIAVPLDTANVANIYVRNSTGSSWNNWKLVGGGGGMIGGSFPIRVTGDNTGDSATFNVGRWKNIMSTSGAGRIDKLIFSYAFPGGGTSAHFDWIGRVTVDGVAYDIGANGVMNINGYNYFSYVSRPEPDGNSANYYTNNIYYYDASAPIEFSKSLSVDLFVRGYADQFSTTNITAEVAFRII